MALSKRDRMRRAVLLCASFARNLAYYRAGHATNGQSLLDQQAKHAGFWRQVNGNCIDIAVLDWCKLFADASGEHHWRKIVSDKAAFEAALLSHLGMSAGDFADYMQRVKRYRNKFVAHLNQDKIMDIPDLAIAQKAVWLLHAHIATKEATPADLTGMAHWNMQLGYDKCVAEAEEVFRSTPKG